MTDFTKAPVQICTGADFLRLGVHFAVILQIVAGDDMVHPHIVLKVPLYRLSHAPLEGILGSPAQLRGDLGVVDGVAPVVAGTVLHVTDKTLRLVEHVQNEIDDLDIGPLVVAAYVITNAVGTAKAGLPG